MDEVLTWEEIERRFDGEWVVLDEPEVTNGLEIVRGRVVYHGSDRHQADAVASQPQYKNIAIWFLGPAVPEGTVAIL